MLLSEVFDYFTTLTVDVRGRDRDKMPSAEFNSIDQALHAVDEVWNTSGDVVRNKAASTVRYLGPDEIR